MSFAPLVDCWIINIHSINVSKPIVRIVAAYCPNLIINDSGFKPTFRHGYIRTFTPRVGFRIICLNSINKTITKKGSRERNFTAENINFTVYNFSLRPFSFCRHTRPLLPFIDQRIVNLNNTCSFPLTEFFVLDVPPNDIYLPVNDRGNESLTERWHIPFPDPCIGACVIHLNDFCVFPAHLLLASKHIDVGGKNGSSGRNPRCRHTRSFPPCVRPCVIDIYR